MKELKVDKTIKEIIPALTEEEYTGLEEDIKKRGCRHPIDVWKGKDIILDGHNRYEICIKNDIKFEINEMEFETKTDALEWMINNQLNRRNLTDAKKIELALKRNKLRDASPCQSLSREARKEIAKELKVSEGNVEKVKVVVEEGSKSVKKKMLEGKETINKAYKETRHIENPPKPPPPADTVLKLEKPEDYLSVHPGIPPEGYQWCHYCKGTGIEKKPEKPKVVNDGKKHCSMCNGTVFDGDKCKTCGLVNK